MMKKVFCLLLATLLIFSLAGCGTKEEVPRYTADEIAQRDQYLTSGKSFIIKHLRDKYGFEAEIKTAYVITENPTKISGDAVPKYLPIVFAVFSTEGKCYKAYADLQTNPAKCYDNYEIDNIQQELANYMANQSKASFRGQTLEVKSTFANSSEITESLEVLNQKFTTIEDLLKDTSLQITIIGEVYNAKTLDYPQETKDLFKNTYATVVYNAVDEIYDVIDKPLTDDCFKHQQFLIDFYRDGTLFTSENRWTGYKSINPEK